MNPVSLQVHLRKIGVPPQRGRTSPIRHLVLQAPAPVIAKALGYRDRTATRLVTAKPEGPGADTFPATTHGECVWAPGSPLRMLTESVVCRKLPVQKL
ncbi:hypothetical protein TNCT6_70610 [Streptomyces sp. 6-11-2]|nr:hypothetical protein TNCT6_70610 [Streptomyces sp. 6-11-2]